MPPKKKQQREEKVENPKILPKKKTNTSSVSSSSSTKKPIPQPSKYGIQHFFDRHTIQHSQKQQANNSTSQVDSVSLPPPEKPNYGKAPSSQDVTPDNLVLPVATDPTEVSPEISKSMSRKRFKFSPGMVTYFCFFAFDFGFIAFDTLVALYLAQNWSWEEFSVRCY